MLVDQLQPGARVRVTQTIQRRDGDWQTSVTGEVISCRRQKTGSWYAHSPTGRLMLTRVSLRKDDGELAVLNIDERSRVDLLQAAGGG